MGMRDIAQLLERWQLDISDVRERMYRSPTPRERERWHALWLLAQGWTALAVAEALEREPHTMGTFLDKSPYHFPVPVRQVDACLFGQSLHRSLQLGLLDPVEGGGDPPLCSKTRAVGPLSLKAATHAPMVWGSRSSASATAEAVQPWAKSQRPCHRSRSRGVGARYIRSRTSLTSSCHRSRSCTMSLIPNTTATRFTNTG